MNPRPSGPEPDALPAALHPEFKTKNRSNMKAAAILVGDDGIEPPQVESESTALPLCKSPMTFAWSNKCSQQLFIIAAECVFVNRFFEIFAKAMPHHSKCRCSEREMQAAKQKAQIILCVLSSIFWAQIVLRSRGSSD